jgi:hypothetical protein
MAPAANRRLSPHPLHPCIRRHPTPLTMPRHSTSLQQARLVEIVSRNSGEKRLTGAVFSMWPRHSTLYGSTALPTSSWPSTSSLTWWKPYNPTCEVGPWYISNTQIHEDLGVPSFADHIRALTESFDSKLADAGNPLVRQLGRYLRWLRIHPMRARRKSKSVYGYSQSQQLRLPDRENNSCPTGTFLLPRLRVFRDFFSLVRRIPGYNGPHSPSGTATSLKCLDTVATLGRDYAILGSNPRKPSNQGLTQYGFKLIR